MEVFTQQTTEANSQQALLLQKQKQFTKNMSPRKNKKQPRLLKDEHYNTDDEDYQPSTSSELGSLDDSDYSNYSTLSDEGGFTEKVQIENQVFAQKDNRKGRKSQRVEGIRGIQMKKPKANENTMILLYVIKIAQQGNYQSKMQMHMAGASHRKLFEFFKMRLDCAQCSMESENDEYLRKFRRRVKRKLQLNDNFKIFSYQGHPIQDDELSFLNQDGMKTAVVYVSQSLSFDFELYLRLFHEIKKLGEGGFGQVYLGQHIITKQQFAIKVIYPTVFKADEAQKAFKEAQVLQNLKHQSILKLYNVFQLPDTRIILFMEYLEGGSLREYLDSQNGKLTEQEAQIVMYEVGNALNYCHQRRIVHRDIKLENIMLRHRGDIGNGLVIIDFGIAGRLQNTNEKHHEGTVRYSPPELITGQSYKADQSFDVWSLGVLLYRMVYGCYPFDGPTLHDIRQSIINYNFKEQEQSQDNGGGVSDTCYALIRLMLNKDPKKRPKLYQLIQHLWFTNSKQHQLMHSTFYQQSTLMNFFKQELRQIEIDKEIKQQKQNDDQLIKIKLNGDSINNDGNQQYKIMLPQSREKKLNKNDYNQSSKKFSPSPVNTRQRPQAFIGSSDYIALMNQQQGKLPREESISSLSLKKQQLSEIRNFIEASQIPYQQQSSLQNPTNKDFRMQLVEMDKVTPTMQKHKRWETHHRRNPNLGSIIENKIINNPLQQRSESLTFKKDTRQIMVSLTDSKTKPPSRFAAQQSRSGQKISFENESASKVQNQYRNLKLLEIIESNDFANKFKEMPSFELPEIVDSPVRGQNSFGYEVQKTFDEQLQSVSSLQKIKSNKYANASTIQSSSQQLGIKNTAIISQSKEFLRRNQEPSILKKSTNIPNKDYKKFITKLPTNISGQNEDPNKSNIPTMPQTSNNSSQLSKLSHRKKQLYSKVQTRAEKPLSLQTSKVLVFQD